MNKNLKTVNNITNSQFEILLEKKLIKFEVMEKHLHQLLLNKEEDLFLKRLELIKNYEEDFLKLNNCILWSWAIINKDFKWEWLSSLGFEMNANSRILEFVFTRKFLYEKFYPINELQIAQIIEQINEKLGSEAILKSLENVILNHSRANIFFEPEWIEMLDNFYNKYQSNEKEKYVCRFIIVKNQIAMCEKTITKKLTDLLFFTEVLLPNILLLLEKTPMLLKKIETMSTKDDNYKSIIKKTYLRNKLDNQIDSKELEKNNRVKI